MSTTSIESLPPLAQSVLEKGPGLTELYHRYNNVVSTLMANGHVRPGDLVGKRILDWECGAGVYALLFVERGAAHVDAIDSWLWTEECQKTMGHIPQIKFGKISLEDYASDRSRHGTYDFVFANTVTEHMLNLPKQLPIVGRLLKPGGLFVTNHDNYYQPVGSHDHGFLYYGADNKIQRQGPACWESSEKCEASRSHRLDVMKKLPWTWDASMEKKLTPQDCTQCPYFKRSQPWGHLRHQAEFKDVYPQPCFTTGYHHSSLNKITQFQLRQWVIEAGLDIQAWIQNRINNEVPEVLLRPPFNFREDDLTTATITVVARKSFSPYGE